MKKVALISFGCAKNLVDSEVMLGFLNRAGYTFTLNPKEADILILNTCGFINPAKREAERAIKNAVRLKKQGKKVIAVGCYVERYKDILRKKYTEVDGWLGVNDYDKIVMAIREEPFREAKECFLYDHKSPRWLQTPRGWAYIKISEGCSHKCSFCAIPLIKGPYQSRPISSIVKEAKNLAAQGVKEINLISQDTTYFGKDKGMKEGLRLLLEKLLEVQDVKWIRILYSYPEEISDSLLEIMKEDKICSYLDIPFQHSDSKIIKAMRRSMDGKRALSLIQKIRKKLPDVALRTSLVVGFPGESMKEFAELKQFISEARFDHLGVFTYSREEGTDSYSLGDAIKEAVKINRKNEIMEIQAEISYQKNIKYLSRHIDVLIEGTLKQNSSQYVARARFQAPEVDGIILVESSSKIPEAISTIQKVEIIDRDVYDLYGKLT